MEIMECESETQDMVQDISFTSVESTESNLLSEISITRYGVRLDSEEEEDKDPRISEEPKIFEEFENPTNFEVFEEFENSKPEFPNDAYRDLMLLVTDHNLSNKAGNAIIRFFNKHSALPKSPLPKNIERGREFMNKMNFPNLVFNKICIAHHNGEDYFLHYQNLINCIKNILAMPDIIQDFALSFKDYVVR